MHDRFPIKENYREIIKDFKAIKFACISCGSRNLEITAVEPYADGINVHGHYELLNRDKDI